MWKIEKIEKMLNIKIFKRILFFFFIFPAMIFISLFVIFNINTQQNNRKLYLKSPMEGSINFFQNGYQKRQILTINHTSTTPSRESSDNIHTIGVQNYEEMIENIPEIYFTSNASYPKSFNETCASFPDFFDIQYNNLYWQVLHSSRGIFYLMNAYYDDRLGTSNAKIRILASIDRIHPISTYCQLWFKEHKTVIVRAKYEQIWHPSWGGYKNGFHIPNLITCPVPKEVPEVPISVALVEKTCSKASNNLKIFNDRRDEKEDFAVCVKGLNFIEDDLTTRMAEWIELIFLLGAKEIFFYNFNVHPNVNKLLSYYKKQGKVHIKPLTLAGIAPNIPHIQEEYLKKRIIDRRQQELLPYNDCFYKNIYKYKYIVLLDTDEFIMPRNGTWKELIEMAHKKYGSDHSAFYARNIYFLDSYQTEAAPFNDIPNYMHILQHVRRSKKYTKPIAFVKSFHNTKNVLTLGNHYPKTCLKKCTNYPIGTELAQMQHYRKTCVKDIDCKQFTEWKEDKLVWKFKDELIQRVNNTLINIWGS